MRARPFNRVPKEVPGKIIFRWAKDRHQNPDWFAVWHQPADRGSCNLILQKLPELVNELVKRGYDPKSIKFECAMKQPPPKSRQMTVACVGRNR